MGIYIYLSAIVLSLKIPDFNTLLNPEKMAGVMERKRSCGFYRIFTIELLG